MSDSRTSPSNDAKKTVRRNLPSWMSSRENDSKPCQKKPVEIEPQKESDRSENLEQDSNPGKAHTGSVSSKKNEREGKSSESSLGGTSFSKLLEGVVFVLSGFVNPERGVLRSQALEMGAEYQPDWNSGCTLLICAFPNTPKFRQVEADCGTIVSKEWISECYTQKKLVEIESHLMHAGKPWRRQNGSHESSQDQESSMSSKSQKLVERGSSSKTTSALPKSVAANSVKEHFSTSQVKKWAVEDVNKTISWLESQEEKPEPSEMKKIAAEGILTCLQDAIDSLQQKQDIRQITEQWNFVPRVVEELAKLDGVGNGSSSLPKEDLYQQAVACKRIYEAELSNLDIDSSVKKKKRLKSDGSDTVNRDSAGYDSDETVEMTEEEIDLAYNTVASKLRK